MPNQYRHIFRYNPATREVEEVKLPTRGSRRKSTWPLKSDALGVHKDQRMDAIAESIAVGVPTDFTPDGRAVLESKGHRKRYAEALGYWDRDGGFSDPQRR